MTDAVNVALNLFRMSANDDHAMLSMDDVVLRVCA